MSVLSRPYFHDEAEAFAHVEAILWPQRPICHHCGSMEKHYALKGVRSKPSKKNPHGVERHGLYKCSDCRAQFTVRMGTIFEESHLPLHKWLQAIHLMCSSKKGVSSHQLHRVLECTYKTAWFLAHRIRESMRPGETTPMGGAGMTVEADETYIGRLEGQPVRRGGGSHKNTVLTLVERGGRARSFHVESATVANIMPIVRANVAKETAMMTDEWGGYRYLGGEFASHETVVHSKKEYVRGHVHTNFGRGLLQHLQARHEGRVSALRRTPPAPLSRRIRLPLFEPHCDGH